MPLLSLDRVSIAFRENETERTVVNQVSFTVEKGKTTALVGESGCGKTVTALSVLRLLPEPPARVTGGKILFDGIDLLALPPRKLRAVRGGRVGMIFQEPMTALNPLHTIEKQIAETLRLHQSMGRLQARARVIELLHQVGLGELENRLDAYPHQLSGGQRQRVMIAMAIANKPDLLIADEPTTALDVTVQEQILALLKELQQQMGMAILLITHDLGIVRHVADHVCVMQHGELVDSAPARQVFSAPSHAYTKELLAAEPKGRPLPTKDDAPLLAECSDLVVSFPVKKNFFGRVKEEKRAVDGVSITVRRGETLGIVGESGSGKTTLGLALLRLIRSQGGIRFGEQALDKLDTAALRPLRRQMQIVFQDPYSSLNPRMSIRDIIGEGLDVHGLAQGSQIREDRICDALKDVGLDPEIRHRYPHEFSGGQRQRINIARAMVLHPEFLVLDEPTSALDLITQGQIVQLLRHLQEKHGLSYLFISHDLRVVKALSHRVAVMKDGKIVEENTSEALFDSPRKEYTKRLIQAAFLGGQAA